MKCILEELSGSAVGMSGMFGGEEGHACAKPIRTRGLRNQGQYQSSVFNTFKLGSKGQRRQQMNSRQCRQAKISDGVVHKLWRDGWQYAAVTLKTPQLNLVIAVGMANCIVLCFVMLFFFLSVGSLYLFECAPHFHIALADNCVLAQIWQLQILLNTSYHYSNHSKFKERSFVLNVFLNIKQLLFPFGGSGLAFFGDFSGYPILTILILLP